LIAEKEEEDEIMTDPQQEKKKGAKIRFSIPATYEAH